MLRTASRPRWVALLVLVLVAATGMSLLGQWQLDRARQQSAKAQRKTELEQQRRPSVPLESLFRARQTFPAREVGRPVTATGTWDSGRQVLVPGRPLDGRDGFWVLTPLRLADGSAVPVVRGWVPRADDPAARLTSSAAATADGAAAGSGGSGGSRGSGGSGVVTVTGALRPSDAPADRAPGAGFGVPAGQLPNVSVVDLLDLWPYPLYTGYLIQGGQQPPAATALTPARLPPPAPGLAWKNLSYAVQWWVFAAFGLFFWFRLVRDDHLGRLAPRPAPDASGAAPDAGGAPEYAATGPVGEDERP